MIDVYQDTTQIFPVVRLDYTDPVETWQEYDRAVAVCYRLALSLAPTLVYMIHNPGHVDMPPGNVLRHLRQAIDTVPDNIAGTCMVVQNPMARYITEVTMKILVPAPMVSKYAFVQTLDAAYAYVQAQESSQKNA